MTDKELDYVGTTIALLSGHSYWKDELWRKRLKTHRDDLTADVENAFFAMRMLALGIYTTPVGSCWAHNVPGGFFTTEEKKRAEVLDYYDPYQDIMTDYCEWLNEQR